MDLAANLAWVQVGSQVVGEPAVSRPEGLGLGRLGVLHDAEPVIVGVETHNPVVSDPELPAAQRGYSLDPVPDALDAAGAGAQVGHQALPRFRRSSLSPGYRLMARAPPPRDGPTGRRPLRAHRPAGSNHESGGPGSRRPVLRLPRRPGTPGPRRSAGGAPGIPPARRSTRLRRFSATGPAGRPNPGGVSPLLRPCASGKPVPFPGSGPGRRAAGCHPAAHAVPVPILVSPGLPEGWLQIPGVAVVRPSARAALGSGSKSLTPGMARPGGPIGSGPCPAGPAPSPPRPG